MQVVFETILEVEQFSIHIEESNIVSVQCSTVHARP